jgi:hypothetical protein
MPKTFKFLRWSGKKAVALLVLTAMLVTLTVGSTIAYIIVKTQDLTNTFVPPIINIDDINGNDIKNSGDIPVYVRAAIVPTWISESDGSTLSQTPTVEITVNSGWTKGSDGFYYYTSPVAAGTSVAPIVTAKLPTDATIPDGYTLKIQVLSAAIQATPAEAVTTTWGVTVNGNGTLTVN